MNDPINAIDSIGLRPGVSDLGQNIAENAADNDSIADDVDTINTNTNIGHENAATGTNDIADTTAQSMAENGTPHMNRLDETTGPLWRTLAQNTPIPSSLANKAADIAKKTGQMCHNVFSGNSGE